MENESGKHYFSLDSPQFTLYPDEQEILLQAGIRAKVIDFHEKNGMKVFSLYTSEKMIRRRHIINLFSFYMPTLVFFVNHTISAANQINFFNDAPEIYTGLRYVFDFIFTLPALYVVRFNRMKGILPGITCLLLSYLLVIFVVFGGPTNYQVDNARVAFNVLSIVSLACFSSACVINKLYLLFISFLLNLI